MTHLQKLTVRGDIPVLYAPLVNMRLEHKTCDLVKSITTTLTTLESQYRQGGLNTSVYSDLIDYQIIEQSEKGIHCRKFSELQCIFPSSISSFNTS